jgi:hypothetical protein
VSRIQVFDDHAVVNGRRVRDLDAIAEEHEAMSSTLIEAENHVPEATMKLLRRYYADLIRSSREHAGRA